MMESNQELQNEMSEEIAQLLSSSLSYQDSYLSQNGVSSNMWGSSINASHSVLQMPHQDAQFVRGESSRASMEESSLIADANSPFSGVSYLTGNSSNSIDSPASNCGRIPVTLTRDHFSAPQQTFQAGKIYPRWYGRQGGQLPSPTFSPPMMIPAHQASVPSVINLKKPRLEITQEDLLHAYSLKQLSPSQTPMQLRSYDRVATSRLYQQNFRRNQQQNQTRLFVPSPLGHQMQYLFPPETPEDAQRKMAATTALNGSICARRLMYYLHQRRTRPADNNIEFWRKLVEEYFSPLVKKRWCLSMYNKGCQDNWKCDLCGSKSGKGFEATYEILPRLSQIYFDSSGVIDELLYIDSPVEKRMPSGAMMLWFNKAVQEGTYKNFRVVHEGQLRILFAQDLKIISWEFCIQRHEELISRSLGAAQVNQFVEEAAKCQSNSVHIETEAVQAQEVATCNRVMVAGKKLATNLELSIVNDAGFSKQFVRYLQMSQVLDCMKGLISMCADSQTNNFSPIEALKRYRQEAAAKLKKHMEDGAQMPQTPSADGNIHMSYNMTQTPNASEQAMLIPPDNHQNKFLEGHRVTPDSYQSSYNKRLSHSASYQRSISSVKSLSAPSSFLMTPPVDRQINDLLAQLRADGTPGIFCKNARSKRRLMYDPKIDPQVMGFAEHTEVCTMGTEANTPHMMGGTVDKGKGFNSSSSSNSSARIFADNCMNKRESVSDDDSTSAGNRQQVEEK